MDQVAGVLRDLALSVDEIAARSRLPVERIQAIIGGAPVSLADLRALSRGLRIPMRTFAAGRTATELNSDLGLLFRKSARDSTTYEATVEHVAGFVQGALDILPKRHEPPEWLHAFMASEESYAEAHRLADQFRQLFLSERIDEPAIELPKVLTELGAVILARLHFSRYEGVSVIAGGYCFVFVSPRFSARMLFTLAHELGHLIAHKAQDGGAIFERPSQIGNARSRSKAERVADAFASVLLLPDRGIGIALRKIRDVLAIHSGTIGDVEILLLARIFGVSFEVAARRCEELELLPAGGAFALTDRLKKEFGNPERRADGIGLPARPKIAIPKVSENLLAVIVEKIRAGVVSVGWAADHFGLSINEIYSANAGAGRELRH